MTNVLRWALAIALPIVILGGGARWIATARDDGDRGEHTVGAVVTGSYRPRGTDSWVAEQLAAREPDVIVVGDSLARADIDEAVLGRALGVEPRKILTVSLPASIAPHWVALLDNHVFDAGYRPRLVIVVGALRSMLETRPSSPISWGDLESLLAEDDGALRRRVDAGSGSALLDSVLVNRVKARRLVVEALRSGAVGLLLGPRGPDRMRWGQEVADRASARVFDRRDLDLALTREILPMHSTDLEGVVDPADLPAPSDSFVPDLLAFGPRHGVRVVLVRPPLSPLMPPEGRDVVADDVSDAVGRLARDAGGAWLDGSAIELGIDAYRDLAHLGPPGAARFSAILGGRIARLDQPSPAPAGLDLLALPATFLVEPPLLATEDGRAGPARTVRWPVPQVAPVVDRMLAWGLAPEPGCLPLEVREDDRVLPLVRCQALLEQDAPGSCFDGTTLFARGSGSSAPAVSVDPERGCGAFRWLYPGDVVRIPLPPGASGSVLGGVVFGDAPPELVVTLRDSAGTVIDELRWRAPRSAGTLEFVAAGSPAAVDLRNDSDEHLVVVTALEFR